MKDAPQIATVVPSGARWFSDVGEDMLESLRRYSDANGWRRLTLSAARYCRSIYRDARPIRDMRVYEIRFTPEDNEWGHNVFVTIQYARNGNACSAMGGRFDHDLRRFIWQTYAD